MLTFLGKGWTFLELGRFKTYFSLLKINNFHPDLLLRVGIHLLWPRNHRGHSEIIWSAPLKKVTIFSKNNLYFPQITLQTPLWRLNSWNLLYNLMDAWDACSGAESERQRSKNFGKFPKTPPRISISSATWCHWVPPGATSEHQLKLSF